MAFDDDRLKHSSRDPVTQHTVWWVSLCVVFLLLLMLYFCGITCFPAGCRSALSFRLCSQTVSGYYLNTDRQTAVSAWRLFTPGFNMRLKCISIGSGFCQVEGQYFITTYIRVSPQVYINNNNSLHLYSAFSAFPSTQSALHCQVVSPHPPPGMIKMFSEVLCM